MSIFDLNHMFVVFPAGAGGNFVTGLIEKIRSNDLSEIYISSVGSSHTVNNEKSLGKDSISFGTIPDGNIFKSIEEKELYYLDKINKEYQDAKQVITWSHDFSNLPLYKKHFLNCKTLTITCFSVEEKLSSVLMHVNKVFLSDESSMPISWNLWTHLKSRLKSSIKLRLENLIDKKIDIDDIFEKRFTCYNNLIFYLSCVSLLNYAGLVDVLNLLKEKTVNLNPNANKNIRTLILESSDAILPYSYLRDNEYEKLESAISIIFQRDLSVEEKSFLKTEFFKYRSKQDILILKNPVEYFNFRKEKALEELELLKRDLE